MSPETSHIKLKNLFDLNFNKAELDSQQMFKTSMMKSNAACLIQEFPRENDQFSGVPTLTTNSVPNQSAFKNSRAQNSVEQSTRDIDGAAQNFNQGNNSPQSSNSNVLKLSSKNLLKIPKKSIKFIPSNTGSFLVPSSSTAFANGDSEETSSPPMVKEFPPRASTECLKMISSQKSQIFSMIPHPISSKEMLIEDSQIWKSDALEPSPKQQNYRKSSFALLPVKRPELQQQREFLKAEPQFQTLSSHSYSASFPKARQKSRTEYCDTQQISKNNLVSSDLTTIELT